MMQPVSKPEPVQVRANIDPEQQRREDDKIRQLTEMKRKAQEAKNNPPPVKQPEPKPVVVQEETKIDPNKFLVEQKEVLKKIRKPKVEEVSAFDDIHSGATFAKQEDPYAGKSFAEVLKMKREKLEAQLKANAPPPVKEPVVAA